MPWRSLGVAQGDALDAWNTMISYRVWGGAGCPFAHVAQRPDGPEPSKAHQLMPVQCDSAQSTTGWRHGVCSVCNAEGFVFVMIRHASAGNVVASKANGNGVAYVLDQPRR